MPCCCVRHCTNRSETKKKGADGITFHLFPRNEIKRKRWMRAVGREDWSPSSASVVCSRHFDASCFYTTRGGLVRLLDHAIPSLFIRGRHESDAVTSASEPVSRREGGGGLERLAVLRAPEPAADDPPEARRLAADVRCLLALCKKQRRTIRTLQRRLRERRPQLTPSLQQLEEQRPEEETVKEALLEEEDLYWA